MPQLDDIVRTLKTMPPLPNVARRVLEIVRDPEFSIDELIRVVRIDPALTGRTLKLCNSALFALPAPVGSVADAVAYLGTRNLVKLVVVSCSATYFGSARRSAYTDPQSLWQHTYACAIAAQWLAQRAGHAQPEAAFTLGILHNLGKVALSQVVDDDIVTGQLANLRLTPGTDLTVLETRLFGIDHAAAAAVVAEAWNLPADWRRALRWHHDESHCASDDPLTAILGIADALVLQLGIGNPFPGTQPTAPAAALTRLRLDAAALEAATAHVTGELQRSTELLNLDRIDGR